jgi:hypothetical protein
VAVSDDPRGALRNGGLSPAKARHRSLFRSSGAIERFRRFLRSTRASRTRGFPRRFCLYLSTTTIAGEVPCAWDDLFKLIYLFKLTALKLVKSSVTFVILLRFSKSSIVFFAHSSILASAQHTDNALFFLSFQRYSDEIRMKFNDILLWYLKLVISDRIVS